MEKETKPSRTGKIVEEGAASSWMSFAALAMPRQLNIIKLGQFHIMVAVEETRWM